MSSLPPSGPPTGPLSPTPPPRPDPGPPPGQGGGPRWRSKRFLVWLVVGVVIVVAAAVVLVPMLGGKDEKPSRTPEEAKQLAAAVAARSADWGAGFTDGDESYDTGELVPQQDCKVVLKADRPGTVVSFNRTALKGDAMGGYSEVWVFEDEDKAKTFVDDFEDGIHRCPAQTYGEARYGSIREGATGQLTGFEEVVAEQGVLLVDDYGTKMNQPYSTITGWSGEVVLLTYLLGPTGKEKDVHAIALSTLQKMQKRLAEQ
ncbi:hypothetical protein [Streptomyces sp. SP18CS02]|uniref:hypothetical protein n=1 Tax=Streptomyces sp. SP18CS02 TaxID=3002531 RepID=UPI002E7A02A4|nr:hypothetical protein [Streptomyces sp. SP18CS02]MEE1755397.1 hypothetical protein [Streptomyces sp. SP18CS02]